MRNNIYSSLVLLSLFIGSCSQKKNENCFRRTTDSGWEKLLSEGVCLPDDKYAVGFVIDDVDFNQDGLNDLIINYYNFPSNPGDTSFYEFFLKKEEFFSVGRYANIDPPILGHTKMGARDSPDSLIRKLFHTYPYSSKITLKGEFLFISQFIPDDFGKTHVFEFDEKQLIWELNRIEYWAGEIDPRDVERMELSPDLVGKVILEVLDVSKPLLLKDFDLIASKRRAFGEERDYLELKYDIFEIGRK